MSNRKILAIIPARGGSKGVTRKNVKFLGKKPLLNWTIDAALNSKYIDKVVVSTEDDEIKSISIKSGVAVINRPLELSSDEASTIDVILHSLEKMKQQKYFPDIVVLLQCTSPFRSSKQIDEAISIFLEDNFKSLFSVQLNDYPPYWLKKVDDKREMTDFLYYDKAKLVRRQDFETTYKLNGAIYISMYDEIINNKSFYSNKNMAYMMDKISSIDIDTEDDFEYAKYILEKTSLLK